MLLVTRDAAIRAGTAIRLTAANIDGGSIRAVTKWDGSIIVPMSDRLRAVAEAAVRLAPEHDTPLIVALGAKPGPWVCQCMSKRLISAQKRAAAGDWTWHDLRRTAAQAIYRNSGDLRKAQALLGHKSMLATLHYLNAARESITPHDLGLFASGEAAVTRKATHEEQSPQPQTPQLPAGNRQRTRTPNPFRLGHVRKPRRAGSYASGLRGRPGE